MALSQLQCLQLSGDLTRQPWLSDIRAKPTFPLTIFMAAADGDTDSFHLVTQAATTAIHRLTVGNLETFPFMHDCATFILIHGYLSSSNSPFPRDIAGVLLNRGHATNVILVDWRQLASDPSYELSVAHIYPLGQKVAGMMQELFIKNIVLPDRIHIVGFSLGAHVAGMAGKYFFGTTAMKVRILTALDAAGPNLRYLGSENRLCASDAEYVQAIVTSQKWGCGTVADLARIKIIINNYSHGFENDATEVKAHRFACEIFLSTVINKDYYLGMPATDYEQSVTNVGKARFMAKSFPSIRRRLKENLSVLLYLVFRLLSHVDKAVFEIHSSNNPPPFITKNLQEEFAHNAVCPT